ncbi:MAG: hypothetical protein M5U34_12380 [Chloroflexi bacterium]|nr:hypothetical protein [Chloroflexota bacterium]
MNTGGLHHAARQFCYKLCVILFTPHFFVLLLAVVFEGTMAQVGETAVSTPPSAHPTNHPSPPGMQPTLAIDRLAPPPTVENPTQLDEGAYLYWLYCIPCHGDKGQA